MLYRPCVLNIFLDINALLLVTMIITSDYSIFKISKSSMNSPDQQNEEANKFMSNKEKKKPKDNPKPAPKK